MSQQGFRFEYAKADLRSSVYYSFFDTMFEEQQEIEAPLNSTDPLIISILFPLFPVHAAERNNTNTEVTRAVHILCDFYGDCEDQQLS